MPLRFLIIHESTRDPIPWNGTLTGAKMYADHWLPGYCIIVENESGDEHTVCWRDPHAGLWMEDRTHEE